jgi:ADP-heptose:LPS heptosyltransferase
MMSRAEPERIPNMAEALLVAHEDKLRKMEAAVRWRIRRMLSMLPPKAPGAPGRPASPSRIAYLFTGTYGDFVQILPSLRRLATAYPKADLVLCGGEGYAREFATEVPRILRLAKGGEPWSWAFSPADPLLTNAVGVFRGRFDLAARLCARKSFGFRHEHESARGGYTRTLRLEPSVSSFAEENMRLLDLAQVPEAWGVGPGPGAGMVPYEDAAVAARPAEPWGRGRILFHIGSAGLKRDFGLNAYSRIIADILSRLEERRVELLMGPGDEDVAAEVRIQSRFTPQEQAIPRLIRALRAFEGTVLCFNSFMAHLCHYLGKPAVVIHRGEVPFGYDCSVIHRQVVLRPALGVQQETEAGLIS